MAASRQTLHRKRRETQEIRAREVEDYRNENQRLRRTNAKLKRELEKFSTAWESNHSGESEEPMTKEEVNGIPATIKTEYKEGCPECGSPNTGRVKIGAKTIVACKDCGRRKVE